MTYIYFVRHAEPNFDNHDDPTRELSAKGMRDRQLVADYMKGKQLDAVLSSPFKRAVDTVVPLAQERGLTIWLMEAFRERKVSDGWIEDFAAFSQNQWKNFAYKLPGGESLSEVQMRNIHGLEQVLDAYSGKSVVIGSHGTALSCIVNHYDPSFGYADFCRIQALMPWIVKFSFHGRSCVAIEQINLFES